MAWSSTPWRRAATAFVLFGGVGVIFLFGAGLLGLSGPAVARRWLSAAQGPWALPGVVVCFAALAFLGVPQFMLVAAAAAVFGPWWGMAYAWIATMISALVGFGLARTWAVRAGGPDLGATATRLMSLIARNGLLASLGVRLVPFAPFVMINMAAGLTEIRWFDFILGTAIGILPKIVLTALAMGSAARLLRGGEWGVAAGLLVVAGLVWLFASLAARRWMQPQGRQPRS